jgi:molybdenum cofactor cytidylyltransferase
LYSGQPGVPVLFEKKYFKALMEIADEEGAKKIIQCHPDDVDVVDFPGGEVDLDTLDDYNTFKNR